MSALTAASVTYTPQGKGPGIIDDSGIRQIDMKMVFGDGSSTYPSGGIPLSNLKNFGFPNVVGSVVIIDASNGDGYDYKWDKVNNKLRIYYPTTSHTHSMFVATGATDTSAARVNAATNSFAMNNTAATIAGIPAASGAAGGVVNVASGAGTEVATSFAPASNVTLYAIVRGR